MDYEVSCANKNEPLTLPVDSHLLGQLMRAEYFNRLRATCEEIGLVTKEDADKFAFNVLVALVDGTEPPKKEEDAKDKEDSFTVEVPKTWATFPTKQTVGRVHHAISNMQSIPRNTTPKYVFVIDSITGLKKDTNQASTRNPTCGKQNNWRRK